MNHSHYNTLISFQPLHISGTFRRAILPSFEVQQLELHSHLFSLALNYSFFSTTPVTLEFRSFHMVRSHSDTKFFQVHKIGRRPDYPSILHSIATLLRPSTLCLSQVHDCLLKMWMNICYKKFFRRNWKTEIEVDNDEWLNDVLFVQVNVFQV